MSRSEAYMTMRYADAKETETHWHTPENYVQYSYKDEELATDQIAVIQNLSSGIVYIHPIDSGVALKDIVLAEFCLKELFTENESVSKAIEKYYKQRFHFFDLIDPDESYYTFI